MKHCALLSAFLFLCMSHAWGQSPTTSSDSLFDIPYKITASQDTLKLDVHQPTSGTTVKNPVVLFLHGGAWARGDKDVSHSYYYNSLKDSLQAKGYAVVAVNYRLVTPTIGVANQVEDCEDALKWMVQQADRYQFDLDKVGIWGESAGAHLGMLVAYGSCEQHPDFPKIRYMIDNFGPTDLNQTFKTNASWFTRKMYQWILPDLYTMRGKLVRALTTYDIDTHKTEAIAVAQRFSPLAYVPIGQRVPTLILHGTRDFIVPIKQSKRLYKELNAALIPTTFIKVKKGGHSFKTVEADEIQFLIAETLDFMEQQLL